MSISYGSLIWSVKLQTAIFYEIVADKSESIRKSECRHSLMRYIFHKGLG